MISLKRCLAIGLSLFIIFAIFNLFVFDPSKLYAQTETGSIIAFTAFRQGQWDIFTISAVGQDLRRLTYDAYEDRDPAFSPDGQQLAYASKREGNWDIYVLDLQTGVETRLTSHAHYDGRPVWHPEGNKLAFESYRSGNLDIWLHNFLTDHYPFNLTFSAPEESGEFDPVWHPNGDILYLSSWQTGNNDIWALELKTYKWFQLTGSSTAEIQTTWHPSLNTLAFTQDNLGQRDVFILDQNLSIQISWVGSLSYPDFHPNGQAMVGVLRHHYGSQIVQLDEGSPLLSHLTENALLQGAIDWHPQAVQAGEPIDELVTKDSGVLYQERVQPSGSLEGEPYNLLRLSDIETSAPWLADTVDDSYQSMRQDLQQELGYDFLGKLAEMYRPINFRSEDSLFTSWHKSGRAFDTRLDLPGGKFEIVREVIGGETYWRMLLRCVDQSGKCGRPVTLNPWNYSQRARVTIAPEQGGIEKPNLTGYYVDFTQIAEMYGWERISSYDDEDFNWRRNFIAFEYWHYQKTGRYLHETADWYQTMLEVHPKPEVDRFFNWDTMRAYGEDPYLIIIKGVPHPPEAQHWWRNLMP